MNAPNGNAYDAALSLLERPTESGEEFVELAVKALTHGLGCTGALVVGLSEADGSPVLLASHWRGREPGGAFSPFMSLPHTPPFQIEPGQKYWYRASLSSDDTATLADQVASCHGHLLADAAGRTWGYLLAVDQGAIANDMAAAMFIRLVAERISSRHLQSTDALKPLLLDRSADYDLALFDSSPVAVSITDANDGSIRYVNNWWCETYGKSKSEIIGTDIYDFYPDRNVRQKLAARMRAEGRVYNEEIEVLSLKSKTPFWILLSLYPITFEGADAILAWTYDINERRQTETELRTSELRFRNLAEGSIQGIVVVDQNFAPLYANQAIADIYGYPSPDIILSWDSLAPFYGQAELDRVHGIVRARFNNDPAPLMYEAGGRRKNGEAIWVQIMARVVEWDSRPAIQATVIDITEQKAAENAVRYSEQRFHDFAEASADWFWETDEAHIVTYVSGNFVEVAPISADNMTGKDFYRIISSAAASTDDYAVLRLIHAREPFRDYVSLFHLPTRDPICIRSSAIPIHDQAGNFIGYRGTTTDITQEVESRRRLQSNADRYLNAIDNMSEGVALWDAEDKLVISNQRFREFSNLTERDFKPGVTFEKYIQAAIGSGNFLDDEGGRIADLQDRLASHHNPPSEIEVRRKNGIFSIREQRTPDGGTITLAFDVSKQRQFEEQLRQAQKMEAVGQLTGGIAHDFNNLLAVISGNLELLENRVQGDANLSRFIDRGLAAAERGAQLTTRLLAFSRSQSLLSETTTLNNLVKGMQDLLGRTIGETIQIRTIVDDDPWPCSVDTGQLENAILNLAINARDAMPNGGTLTIEATNSDQTDGTAAAKVNLVPDHYVALSVKDTGSGMPADVIERAFDPFFTTKEPDQGTGLGLSMVYGLVQQSGGQVHIESTVGVGTTVTLFLPIDRDGAADNTLDVAMPHIETGQNEMILVVEDDHEVREIAVTMLQQLGYQVLQSDMGSDAMDLIAEVDQIGLLLSDVMLPGGMSGRALAEAARALRPDLKILFMSGYARDAFDIDGLPDPGDDLLPKPFRKSELATAVRHTLDS